MSLNVDPDALHLLFVPRKVHLGNMKAQYNANFRVWASWHYFSSLIILSKGTFGDDVLKKDKWDEADAFDLSFFDVTGYK